jgi:aerobic carbon-monoxide dehydrogenase medium subunit
MYPRAFHYHRASTLQQAVALAAELGEEAKFLAGGQSLIPLMKLRLANPVHLVDLSFISGTAYIREEHGALAFGALTRHAEMEKSDIVAKIPMLRDCATAIADVQVRNRGTIGGSLAEADPSGDWAVALLTLGAEIQCLGTRGERRLPLSQFVKDAYTTVLERDEVIKEVVVRIPPKGSGGVYLSSKRAAPVYPTATAAVQLTIDGEECQEIAIALGCVGLTPVQAKDAETVLRGRTITAKTLSAVQEAARAAADPQSDMRGSADYKRTLVGALVKRAIEMAVRRARGQHIEVSPIYA